jgi:trigger factor
MATPAKNQAHIKIHKVEAPQLPEINDDLAKKLGVETVAELRNQVRTHMEQELNNVLKNKLKTQLIDKLIEKNSIELPKALVEKERQHLEKEWLERLRQNMRSPDASLPPEAQEKSLEMARRRVTLSLIFAELIKQHNIQVDNNRVHEQILRIAGSFQEPQAIINMIQKQPEILNGIRSQVMEEQVVDKLLEQVKYNEKSAQYSEVMQFGSEAVDEIEHEHHHHHHGHVHDENCQHDHHGHSD